MFLLSSMRWNESLSYRRLTCTTHNKSPTSISVQVLLGRYKLRFSRQFFMSLNSVLNLYQKLSFQHLKAWLWYLVIHLVSMRNSIFSLSIKNVWNSSHYYLKVETQNLWMIQQKKNQTLCLNFTEIRVCNEFFWIRYFIFL